MMPLLFSRIAKPVAFSSRAMSTHVKDLIQKNEILSNRFNQLGQAFAKKDQMIQIEHLQGTRFQDRRPWSLSIEEKDELKAIYFRRAIQENPKNTNALYNLAGAIEEGAPLELADIKGTTFTTLPHSDLDRYMLAGQLRDKADKIEIDTNLQDKLRLSDHTWEKRARAILFDYPIDIKAWSKDSNIRNVLIRCVKNIAQKKEYHRVVLNILSACDECASLGEIVNKLEASPRLQEIFYSRMAEEAQWRLELKKEYSSHSFKKR